MLHDAQTHRAPADPAERLHLAALSGFGDLPAFDAAVADVRGRVNRRYGELFAADESLSSQAGSLVFTGVDDDPETLSTLARLGFSQPAAVSAAIRAWHHGRIAATRTERGRELFTRLAPRLLDACAATGAADFAFARFTEFFAGLRSGVQVQSLFLARPSLFDLVIRILSLSPRLATILAKRPAALDALLDGDFFEPLDPAAIAAAVALDAEPRAARLRGRDGRCACGPRRAELPHRRPPDRGPLRRSKRRRGLHRPGRRLPERARPRGALRRWSGWAAPTPGAVAVVALGAFGGGEMNARSDLDLMTVYRAAPGGAVSAGKGWAAETVYGRFTQRLVAALSAPTAEGGLYAVDLQLRPSGTAGPVAVSLPALADYYASDAQSWELLALTRARVAWASDAAFGEEVRLAVETALRQPRDAAALAADVKEMRALMAKERPASGLWDLKLSRGGLVDVEFSAQHLQLTHAVHGGPLCAGTLRALEAMRADGLLAEDAFARLERSWKLSRRLQQVLRLALEGGDDPSAEPAGLKALLARAADVARFEDVAPTLEAARADALAVFEAVVG